MENKIFNILGYDFIGYNFPFDNSKDKCDEIIKYLEKQIQFEFFLDNETNRYVIQGNIGYLEITQSFINNISDISQIDILKAYVKASLIFAIKNIVYFKNIKQLFEDLLKQQIKENYIEFSYRNEDYNGIVIIINNEHEEYEIVFSTYDSYKQLLITINEHSEYELKMPSEHNFYNKTYYEKEINDIIYTNIILNCLP